MWEDVPVFAPKIAKGQTKIATSPTSGLAPKPSTLADGPNAATIEAPEIVHELLRSPGRPLDPSARAIMEPRFGHDFSKVLIHADTCAAESARAVGAIAYSIGRNVVFGAGRYAPALAAGRELLAHELAHVVQQDGAPSALGRLSVMRSDESAEREARSAAAAIASGKSFRPQTRSGLALVRQRDPRVPADAGPARRAPAAPTARATSPATVGGGGLAASLTNVTAKLVHTGATDVVTAQRNGTKVDLRAPGVSYTGSARRATGVRLGADSIKLGFIQTVVTERIGVYRRGGDPTGEVLTEQRLSFGPAQDVKQGSSPPFYEPPETITDSQLTAYVVAEDQPNLQMDAAVGEGKLTETKGTDQFTVSLAAQRGSDLVHLKDFAWEVPWSLVLAPDQSGRGGPITIRETNVPPIIPGGPAAGVIGREPSSTIKAYISPAAADAALRENPTAFLADLPRQKAKAPDSYWQMVGALWRSPISFIVKVTVGKTNALFGKDTINVVCSAHTSESQTLKIGEGESAEAHLLAHTVYDPGKLDASTDVTLQINSRRIKWPFPYRSIQERVRSEYGRYNIDASLG